MQRGRHLNFNALKCMEGMPVLVHDIEYEAYDQLCYVEFDYVPMTKKTMEITNIPHAKAKGKKASRKEPIAIRNIVLKNDEFEFVYDFLGNCVNGKFECYAPKEEKE